jgi:hypothetical protein
MGTHSLRPLVVVFVSLFAAAGCGGASDGPPRPLSRHFDDMFLAQLPLDQRKDEIAAKQAYDIAVLEKQKAEADYNESRVQLDVAKNERDAARLDERSAKTRNQAAQSSADLNRMKEGEKELKGATAAREAAEKRYDYLNAYRNWLKRLMRYTEHNMYWREAQYELAQAKLAQSNNIQPKGFRFEDYSKQEQDRNGKTSDAKGKAEREKQTALSARTKWLAIQKEADKLLGKASEFPDPMDPSKVKGVDQTAGAGGYTVGNEGGQGTDQDTQPTQDPTMKTGEGSGDQPEEKKEDGGGTGGDDGGGGSSTP